MIGAILGFEAKEFISFMIREIHPLSPAMEGRACNNANLMLASEEDPLDAILCSNSVRTMELRLACSITHLSINPRLSSATVGEVEQRNNEESMGRFLDIWE